MWVHMHSHGRQLCGRISDYLDDIQPGLAHKVFGGVAVSAALSYVAVKGYRRYCARQVIKERGEAAKQACQNLKDYLAQCEQEDGPVNKEKEAMIVGLELKELKEKLWKGELKAMEVLRAYQRKAMEVNDRLNCVTEPIFEAEAQAVELDLLRPNQRKPLHGIPISIKESINIEGYDCHAGLYMYIDKPVEKDADIVQLLKNLGAVPFMRTNIPQALLTYACSNPVYGRTGNPYNVLRGPGGSSGGEGSLIGGGGSILGLGSDIAGSIRVPAQLCGVYGLKPTASRFLNMGHLPLMAGQTLVRATMGPLARDMDGLIQFSQEVFTPRMHAIDATVPPLVFNDELFEKKGPLRVGYFTSIEGITPHPACVRVIMEVKAALEKKGYKVVPFEPPNIADMMCNIFAKVMYADDTYAHLKDDQVDVCMKFYQRMGAAPLGLRFLAAKLISFVIDPVLGRMASVFSRLPRTVLDWWGLEKQIQEYKTEFYERWMEKKLDAVICPGLPFPAITGGYEDYAFSGFAYTLVYNLVNYPAGMQPVGRVTPQDIQRLRDPSVFPARTGFEKFIVKDSEGTEGMPLAVQCASLPYHEEMVLRVMKDIDTALKQ